MLNLTKKQLVLGAAGIALLILVILAMQPDPISVQTVKVSKSPFQVTLEEEGTTQVCECFQIAAPISGTLHRIDLKEGVALKKGDLIATMSPPPLNPREKEELTQRIRAAEKSLAAAEAEVEEITERLQLARQTKSRFEKLIAGRAISQETFDEQQTQVEVLQKQRKSAELSASAALYELEALKAARTNRRQLLSIKAPVTGTLLRVHEKSERVVQAGTHIAAIGDKTEMEIVVDVLSNDAVKVKTGQTVMIENWGGETALKAYVDRIEPAAFTKVSALGIEEKRVNIIAKLRQPEPRLGDNFRIEAKIILWENDAVLQIPQNALFRANSGWAVFKVDGSQAKQTKVKLGKHSRFHAEIVEGLTEDDLVISHPPNNLEDGSTVDIGEK